MVIKSETLLFEGLKPFSVNAAYVRTLNGVRKSDGASQFCSQIFNILSRLDEAAQLAGLREAFNEALHSYEIEMVAYYPRPVFFTKKGTISSKTIDLSNAEKLIIDCLFLPKFHEQSFPNGSLNLNMDDRNLTSLISKKLPADRLVIEVKISIVERPA